MFGQISPPTFLSTNPGAGLGNLLNVIFKILIIGGGLYTLLNVILAGYAFLGAGNEPKKIEGAWAKIWQSLIGLIFIAGAFVLAAIFGKIFFGRYDFILNPVIPTINTINQTVQPQ